MKRRTVTLNDAIKSNFPSLIYEKQEIHISPNAFFATSHTELALCSFIACIKLLLQNYSHYRHETALTQKLYFHVFR
jgi:hypothetical protein